MRGVLGAHVVLINFGPNLSECSVSFISMAMTDSSSAAILSAPSVLSVVGSARPDDAFSVDELGSQIVALAGRLAAATCRWLLLVAQFDACGAARLFGCRLRTRLVIRTTEPVRAGIGA